jgi:ribosome-associated translation inhibitor RaiA
MGTMKKHEQRVVFDVDQYSLRPGEERLIRDDCARLARQIENFPLADLHVLIEGNARTNDVNVKLTLVLPGTTLVTTDHDTVALTAVERSMSSLIENLQKYKGRLGNLPERQKTEKGTLQELHTTVDLDARALNSAVDGGDFADFRNATLPLEEGLRKRIGRWVQRYPALQARVGNGLEIADLVEEVFLMAFERYAGRPTDLPFGTWLETLIDPAVKELQVHGDVELENIRLAQSARGAGPGG